MTDIEQKALALWNEVRAEREYTYKHTSINRNSDVAEALCRAIEQHEAFRQEVSDVVTALLDCFLGDDLSQGVINGHLHQFIIPAPKPDPLEEVLQEIDHAAMWVDECAKEIRAALEARGLEIREKGK